MKEYEFHEAANIFPLDEEHLDELAQDIRKHGQQVAIELLNGKILDGRRRYLACKKAGKQPRVIEVDVADPVDYVVSLNTHRRHLTPSQLSMCAARATKLKEKYEAEARERQKRKPASFVPENFPEQKGEARDQIGKMFGVSGKSVDHASKVIKTQNPSLIAAADKGLIAVSTAARAASLSEAEQNAMVARVEQAAAEGRKPRSRPAATRQNGQDSEFNGELKGVGLFRAEEAINCLIRIPKKDALRSAGFQRVTEWIKDNQ